MIAAQPTKLRDGSWGAKVFGPAKRGDTIEVTTRSGKSWRAKVAAPLWTNGEISIVKTMQERANRSQVRSSSRGDGGPRGENACYMCGSHYCEGARGGLCEHD